METTRDNSTPAPAPAALWRTIARQPVATVHVLRDLWRDVVRYRQLLVEMTWRELADPFAGSMLGVTWSVLHPLLMMAVYAAVFSIIFRGQSEENIHGFDFTVQMMSAYLPWMAFSHGVLSGCSAVRNKANLVKQVVFPLEVLPLKTVLACLLPQAVGTAFVFFYSLIRFGAVPWTWTLWPLLLLFEVMLLGGVVMAVSAIGVYLRDLRDVLQVLFMILFYATPILYTENTLHHGNPNVQRIIDGLLTFNPVSVLVRPFRDACYFGEVRYPSAWALLAVVSVLTLAFGYRTFRKLKPYFGNAL